MTAPFPEREVVVVGGGLTGLATALALHHRGVAVRVLERTDGARHLGTAVSVDPHLLARASGLSTADLPVVHDRTYDLAAWGDLHAWLRTRVERAGVTVEPGVSVTTVTAGGPTAPARVHVRGAGWREASVVVGADGTHSALRRLVTPDQPDAAWSGYLTWRGMVDEADLPAGTPRPPAEHGFQMHDGGEFVLGGYTVPGADRSLRPGRRRLAFAWCDARRHPSLGEPGSLATAPPESVSDGLGRRLAREARAAFPRPWSDAIAEAFHARTAFATPIAEHWPERLVAGPVALLGDAAHTVTPMTGAGLRTGLGDVIALAGALERHGPTPGGLLAYEAERLAPARALVEAGRAMGRSWLHSVAG